MRALLLCFLTCWKCAISYPNMAGSCNGLYGVHIPNKGGGDGGYRISIEDSHIGSDGNRIASIAIQHVRFLSDFNPHITNYTMGMGAFTGFLMKSYDPESGVPFGSFLAPLPPKTMHYSGCPSPASAISHSFSSEHLNSGENIFALQSGFSLQFSWPATKPVAFQLFVVESTHTWFEVYSSSIAETIPPVPPLGCLPELSTAFVLVGFLPLAVLVLAGLLLGLESTSAALSRLSHIFILGPKYAGGDGGDAHGGGRVARLRRWLWRMADDVTFGAWETIAGATVVEFLAHALFFSTQGAALISAITWVRPPSPLPPHAPPLFPPSPASPAWPCPILLPVPT
jgi:hypothetical protein